MNPQPGPGGGQTVAGSLVIGDVIQISDVRGDVTVITRTPPPFRVDAYPIGGQTLSVDEARAQPSRLLLPRYGAVAFIGRERELDDLHTWMNGRNTVGVRLIHGAGGQGKTRLAQQIAAVHAAHGVAVWQMSYTPSPARTAPSQVPLPAGGRALVVIDYADRWPMSALQAVLTDLSTVGGHAGLTLRVLLLARSPDPWWTALRNVLDNPQGIPAPQLSSQALTSVSAVHDRALLFRQAVHGFSRALQVTVSGSVAMPGSLADDPGEPILAVHMAALVGVDAHHHGQAPPTGPHALSAYLLQREKTYWHFLHTRAEGPSATDAATMGCAVYTATLTGALPHSDARAVLRRVALAETVTEANQIINEHKVCYPPDNLHTVFEALRPDRLGEDLIALSTPGHPHTGADDGWTPDAWTATTAHALLDGDPTAWTSTTLTVLAETARRWPHITTTVLDPLLRERPALFLTTGAATIPRLADNPHLDPTALHPLEDLLPAGLHVDLDIAAAAISTRLTAHRLAATADLAEQAQLHATHAVRLANAGLRDQALTPAGEAVTIRRRLASANPAVHLPRLAESLNNLGKFLIEVGRRDEALASAGEATGLYRRSAEANPGAYLPDLAMSLNNLGASLFASGRRDEALAPAGEATDLYRRLTEANPSAYVPDLAMSLNNLGGLLSEVGRREEALAPTEEAVTIRRWLAAAQPATFLPDLAVSLNNLGVRLSELGRRDEALVPATEATDLYRRLADANPAAHLPELARSLNNLGASLADLGRRDEALASAGEATDLYRRLADANPAAYLPDLAHALNNLGASLADLGRPDEALAPAIEATDLYRRLTGTNRAAYLPDLAMSLNNLGIRLSEVGHRAEAVAPVEEAVTIRRRLAEANPAAYLPNLANSLWAYAWVCVNVKVNLPEALNRITEAIELYEPLAERLPQKFAGQLFSAYRTLTDVLDGLGRTDEADDLRRQLARVMTGRHE